MTADRQPEDESRAERDPPGVGPAKRAAPLPWVTVCCIALCVGIFLGLLREDAYHVPEAVSKFGYLPADEVWGGAYWSLVTSAFVHFALWHLAFNVYWLWIFGKRLESSIGSVRFLMFFAASAFVSSAFQLAASDGTGIGASGVVYAMFGFMWLTRDRYPVFQEVMTKPNVQLFVFWLVGCIVVSRLGLFSIGNAAHLSGLLFGAGVAGAFVLKFRPGLMRAALAALVVLAIIPLFWCPWSLDWLRHQAYEAHAAERFDVALSRYTRIIERDPGDSWAHLNRSYVHQSLGDVEAAVIDFQTARELDPTIKAAP